MPVDHLSYSSISAYMACPRSWRFRYLDKAPTPDSPALVFGSAIHDAIEGCIRANAGKQAPNLMELWAGAWETQVQKRANVVWGGDTPEALYNDGVRILSDEGIGRLILGLRALVDASGPAVERRVELRVPGVAVPVIGYVDLVEADGVPADIKTSSKSWGLERAAGETQPLFYLAALNQAGYTLNPGLKFRHYVFVKTRTPKVEILETAHSVTEMFWLFGLISEVWRCIEAGLFPPNPGTWKCSASYCEYWRLCRGK